MTGLQITLLVVAIIILLVFLISYIFSSIVIFSARQEIYRSPKDFNMNFEDITYKSTDGIELNGWYIPGNEKDANEKIVIMAHPWTFNRHGFSRKRQKLPLFKTDVNVLPMAKALNEQGYSVLMFDFRNHGTSGKSITGIGLTEYQGILGAVEYVNKRNTSKPQIGFVSLCMGANSTIIALSKGKETLKNIKFMVAVQPISAEVFIANFMRVQYTSLSLFLVPIVNKLCQMRGGYAFDKMSPYEYAKNIQVPAMYVQAETDPWTNLSDIESFYEVTPTEKEFWMLTGQMKRFDTYNYIGEHPKKILDFAGKYFG